MPLEGIGGRKNFEIQITKKNFLKVHFFCLQMNYIDVELGLEPDQEHFLELDLEFDLELDSELDQKVLSKIFADFTFDFD